MGVLGNDELAGRAPTIAWFRQVGSWRCVGRLSAPSSKSRSELARRVLHIEYAAFLAMEDGLELAVA